MKAQIPWLRVFVEGVVIVGSILLAFGIQAWWDERQDLQRATIELEALAAEIDQTRQDLATSEGRRERRIDVMLGLLRSASAESVPPLDTLHAWLGSLWGASVPFHSIPVLEDLRASGRLAAMASSELRVALTTYVRLTEALIAREERVVSAWEERLRPYLVVKTDALPQVTIRLENLLETVAPRFRSNPTEILADREFQNHLLVRLNRTVGAQDTSRQVVELLTHIANLLRLELR